MLNNYPKRIKYHFEEIGPKKCSTVLYEIVIFISTPYLIDYAFS